MIIALGIFIGFILGAWMLGFSGGLAGALVGFIVTLAVTSRSQARATQRPAKKAAPATDVAERLAAIEERLAALERDRSIAGETVAPQAVPVEPVVAVAGAETTWVVVAGMMLAMLCPQTLMSRPPPSPSSRP